MGYQYKEIIKKDKKRSMYLTKNLIIAIFVYKINIKRIFYEYNVRHPAATTAFSGARTGRFHKYIRQSKAALYETQKR